MELAFLHYRADASELRLKLPRGIHLQEYDGSAWVGLVPFRMAGVMRRPLPDLPPFDSFPELNLRTYVELQGKPGVYFFSLDADCRPIVWGGRMFYDLPYHHARMTHELKDGWYRFTSQRRDGSARFAARYRPIGSRSIVRPGSFEHWATERYCLYAHSPRRGLTRVEVHHAPWPLQAGEVEIQENGAMTAAGIQVMEETPRCHFSAGVQVVSFPREVVSGPVDPTPSSARPPART